MRNLDGSVLEDILTGCALLITGGQGGESARVLSNWIKHFGDSGRIT